MSSTISGQRDRTGCTISFLGELVWLQCGCKAWSPFRPPRPVGSVHETAGCLGALLAPEGQALESVPPARRKDAGMTSQGSQGGRTEVRGDPAWRTSLGPAGRRCARCAPRVPGLAGAPPAAPASTLQRFQGSAAMMSPVPGRLRPEGVGRGASLPRPQPGNWASPSAFS